MADMAKILFQAMTPRYYVHMSKQGYRKVYFVDVVVFRPRLDQI